MTKEELNLEKEKAEAKAAALVAKVEQLEADCAEKDLKITKLSGSVTELEALVEKQKLTVSTSDTALLKKLRLLKREIGNDLFLGSKLRELL